MTIMEKIPQESTQTTLVSFIVTTYNLPVDLLRACLSSILSLSLGEDEKEIIVVDDGSEVSVVNEMLDIRENIIYVRQKNQGLSLARNTGIRMATGQYIQFVDGDDLLLQAPYEHCLDLVRYHNPDIVIFESTRQEHAETQFLYEGPQTGSSYMRNHNLRASACGYIFRRSLIGSNLRFLPHMFHEDEDFTPQIFLRAERVFSTKARAYFYREREDSITNCQDESHISQRLEDTEKILFHLQSLLDTIPEADRPGLNRRIAQLTMDYLYNIIKNPHSKSLLEGAINRLNEKGLYPLPDKNYTRKYELFRRAIDNKVLRRLLLFVVK